MASIPLIVERQETLRVTLVRETIDIEKAKISWIEELLIKVALQSVAEDKDDRPTMNQVVEMLFSHEE